MVFVAQYKSNNLKQMSCTQQMFLVRVLQHFFSTGDNWDSFLTVESLTRDGGDQISVHQDQNRVHSRTSSHPFSLLPLLSKKILYKKNVSNTVNVIFIPF